MGLSKNEYDLLEQLINNLDEEQKKSIASLFNTKKDISVWTTYMNCMSDKKSI